jgi:hypothetical protein
MSRERPPERRPGITRCFPFGSSDGKVHATVNFYDAEMTRPCEIFIVGDGKLGKAGSTLNAILEDAATNVSVALQWGVPAAALAKSVGRVPARPLAPTDLATPDIAITQAAASVLGAVLDWLATAPTSEDLAELTGRVRPMGPPVLALVPVSVQPRS